MPFNANNEWVPIVGYEGFYEVSRSGHVRSVARTVKRGSGHLTIKSRPMKLYLNGYGYLTVRLSLNGKNRMHFVAGLVCEAFHGIRPQGKFAAHRDGNKLNNAADNLAWLTRKENERDKYRHGTRPFGEAVHNAVLKTNDVHAIRKLRKNGFTYRAIAKRLAVSFEMVRGVCAGRTWTQIPEQANAI